MCEYDLIDEDFSKEGRRIWTVCSEKAKPVPLSWSGWPFVCTTHHHSLNLWWTTCRPWPGPSCGRTTSGTTQCTQIHQQREAEEWYLHCNRLQLKGGTVAASFSVLSSLFCKLYEVHYRLLCFSFSVLFLTKWLPQVSFPPQVVDAWCFYPALLKHICITSLSEDFFVHC